MKWLVEPRSGFCCSVSSGKSNAACSPAAPEHQHPTRKPRPVAVMAVRAERGAGTRNRKIGAGDDPERAVERHGQNAAQRRQRSPDFRMLHQIVEVFVSREAKAGRRAIHNGIHWIGKPPPACRDREDDQDLDGLLGQRDPENRVEHLRDPGVFGR